MPETTPPEYVPSVPRHQETGYEAVREVIRAEPGDAWRNATIWRAVEAYRNASEPAHERQVRERVAEQIEANPMNECSGAVMECARIARGEP